MIDRKEHTEYPLKLYKQNLKKMKNNLFPYLPFLIAQYQKYKSEKLGGDSDNNIYIVSLSGDDPESVTLTYNLIAYIYNILTKIEWIPINLSLIYR